MADVPKRSKLPGALGDSVDHALIPGDDIIYEVKCYRGHGLVVTHEHLLLVVGGVMAGLKAHEQHVHRMAYDDIQSIELVPENDGCFNFIGVPLLKLQIATADKSQDSPWNTLTVEYSMLGPTVKLACEVHERIGRRKLLAEQQEGKKY